MLIRRIIASPTFVQQLVASNFAKNRENFKRELCLNVIIPFFHYSLLFYSEQTEMGEHKQSLGGGKCQERLDEANSLCRRFGPNGKTMKELREL